MNRVDKLLATQASAGTSDISGCTLCANEGESFALPTGICDVAYGAKGAFVFRSAQSGTIAFINATFGGPAQGVPKKGYYRLSGGWRLYELRSTQLAGISQALSLKSGGEEEMINVLHRGEHL